MMYSETLLEHFRAPRNAGMMRNADAAGESQEASCGDLARFHLRVVDGRITEIRFQTYGCGPSIAASSLATELVRGWRVEELTELTPAALEAALGGLPDDRRHAATVVVDALHAAAAGYRAAQGPEVSRV